MYRPLMDNAWSSATAQVLCFKGRGSTTLANRNYPQAPSNLCADLRIFNTPGCFANLSRTPTSSTLISIIAVNKIYIVVPPHQEFRVRSNSNAWRHRVARSTNACITLTDTCFMPVWKTRVRNLINVLKSHSCEVCMKGSASSCHVRVNPFSSPQPLHKNDVGRKGCLL